MTSTNLSLIDSLRGGSQRLYAILALFIVDEIYSNHSPSIPTHVTPILRGLMATGAMTEVEINTKEGKIIHWLSTQLNIVHTSL